jgi:endonuclease/exonuclease/phosphatase family metal-dependent hydrolase
MKFLLLLVVWSVSLVAGTLRVATYNLELYVDKPFSNVQPKGEEAKGYIRQSIAALKADVIALQEMGGTNALLELRASLKKEGVDYPYWSHVAGRDHSLYLAFLSKYPIKAERHHRSEGYLFQGKRHYVLRGFGEIDVEVKKDFVVTLMSAHLKSKRMVAEGDQQGIREEEAVILREKVDEFFKARPRGNLILLGDLNDGIDTRTFRTVKGRGKFALYDTRPAEKNGDSLPNKNPRFQPRSVVWTHYYAKEELYSRIDYILISPSLRDRWLPLESYVLAMPNWGAASDHRPVTAAFRFD